MTVTCRTQPAEGPGLLTMEAATPTGPPAASSYQALWASLGEQGFGLLLSESSSGQAALGKAVSLSLVVG